jgi:hypothetical protein
MIIKDPFHVVPYHHLIHKLSFQSQLHWFWLHDSGCQAWHNQGGECATMARHGHREGHECNGYKGKYSFSLFRGSSELACHDLQAQLLSKLAGCQFDGMDGEMNSLCDAFQLPSHMDVRPLVLCGLCRSHSIIYTLHAWSCHGKAPLFLLLTDSFARHDKKDCRLDAPLSF